MGNVAEGEWDPGWLGWSQDEELEWEQEEGVM